MKVFFTASKSWFSRGIRWAGSLPNDKAIVSHVGFLFDDAYTTEALNFGLRSRKWTKVKKDVVAVYDVVGLSDEQETRAKTLIVGELGKFKSFYGWSKIPLMLADGIISKIRRKRTFFFSKLFTARWFPVCSNHVGWGLYKPCKKERYKEWRTFMPDTLHDLIREDNEMKEVST